MTNSEIQIGIRMRSLRNESLKSDPVPSKPWRSLLIGFLGSPPAHSASLHSGGGIDLRAWAAD